MRSVDDDGRPPDRADRRRRRRTLRDRRDAGETLVEILLTVVITGLSVTALVSSLAAAGNAGNAQRASVQIDVLMRNYAEAIKAAAGLCVLGPGSTGTYEILQEVPPPGFDVVVVPAGNVCPSVSNPVVLTLTVTAPSGLRDQMQIRVRTP